MKWSKVLCKIGLHDFERVSKPVPTKGDNGFDFIVEPYALGKCCRCGSFSMVRCGGGLESYYASQVKTKAEWLKILSTSLKE